MYHSNPALVMGWLGVTLSLISTWFQFRRARTISVDGISLTTWFQFILMGVFWCSYGAVEHSIVIVAGSALVAPFQIAIVARLRPWEHRATVIRAGAFIFLCCALPTMLFGWSAGVLGTGVAMAVNRLPQILTLIRHSGDFGVSAGSWTVGTLCSMMWMMYYSGEHLRSALLATGAAAIGNATIAVLAAWRHQQHRGDGFEMAMATT